MSTESMTEELKLLTLTRGLNRPHNLNIMEYLKADGFDDCIIGIDEISGRLIYSKNQMVLQLMKEGMEFEDAIEYLEYNTWNTYVGELTPIYMHNFNKQLL